jgi:hypothetical protein
MAQIFGLAEIKERKAALVAESEVYRQMLRLEVQNIRLYKVRMQRSFALMRLANPLFLLAGSIVGSRLFGRKARLGRRSRWSLLSVGLVAWRIFRNYGPLLQALAAKYFRPRAPVEPAESKTPAANI